MTDSTLTTTVFPIASPPLTAEAQIGLHDFFQVYDAHYDEIMVDLSLSMDGDSNIEMTGRRAPPEQAAVQQRQTRERAEDKFNGLLESAPDAMIIVNTDGNIVQVNSQTETMFGYSRQNLVGQPVDMLLAGRFRGQRVVEPKVRRMGGGPELFALQ